MDNLSTVRAIIASNDCNLKVSQGMRLIIDFNVLRYHIDVPVIDMR